MSYSISVPDCALVKNARVYGLSESVRRAKFPQSERVEELDSTLTPGIRALARAPCGTGHDQWLTGVVAQFDLSFTVKAWIEMERYHFVDFVSSQSTMHRLAKFNLSESYNPHVDPRIVEIMKEKLRAYNDCTDEEERERLYLDALYSNPAGFVLTAGITTNYRQLKTIYRQRKDHRLPEWRDFCRWIEALPESGLITGKVQH